ncbi:MAG: succinate dehydrogenase, cytochrome b556 subunit [Alphaproteobacteria bacterium]|nr:succinate dehydrogenase, cytochrome b556 subunit [Alphaproteobacteria bacterium]
MTDTREALMVARTSDGRTVRRPLSPHLQVYRPQITSVMSILHRITGVALSFGTLLLVWFLVAAVESDAAYARVAWFIGSPVGYLLMFGWSVALWYHFCNGIRHIFWDFGMGLELVHVHASGKAVLVATAVLTVGTWIVFAMAQ